LNLHGVNDVRWTEIQTAEPLVSKSNVFEVEKSPGTDQYPAAFITTGGRTLLSEIHEFIYSIWNKEELPEQWKESIIVRILRRVIKQTVVIRQHHLFTDFKKAYDSVRREVVCNILIEFGIPMELLSQIKLCLYETCLTCFLLRMV